jgi:hypothetical protein
MSSSRRAARQRAQAAELARREAAARRRHRLVAAVASVAAVMLVLTTLVTVRLVIGPGEAPRAATTDDTASVVAAVTTVSANLLDQVGRGAPSAQPRPVTPLAALSSDGKPLVLYVGAEYCPFCAAERWGLIVALARFGTFAGLSLTRSAHDDVYPDTATLSFHGASYSSPYLAFEGVEVATNQRQGGAYAPLDTLTTAQAAVVHTYNAPPYVSADAAGAVPFTSFGNRYLMFGASFSPQVLAGRTQLEIAGSLARPDEPTAQAVLGAANAITSVLCQLTGGQPAQVCAGPAATAYTVPTAA